MSYSINLPFDNNQYYPAVPPLQAAQRPPYSSARVRNYIEAHPLYPIDLTAAVKVLVGIVSYIPVNYIINIVLQKLIPMIQTQAGPQLSRSCNVFQQDGHRLLLLSQTHPVLAVAAVLYITVLGPILEETAFRGYIEKQFNDFFTEKFSSELVAKISTITCTSLLFGAAHLSSFQNSYTNKLAFVFTLVAGVFFSLLREITGDLWAPTALHMTINILTVRRWLNQ
jgi:membrane protease YdiL (CAAX protease family)